MLPLRRSSHHFVYLNSWTNCSNCIIKYHFTYTVTELYSLFSGNFPILNSFLPLCILNFYKIANKLFIIICYVINHMNSLLTSNLNLHKNQNHSIRFQEKPFTYIYFFYFSRCTLQIIYWRTISSTHLSIFGSDNF